MVEIDFERLEKAQEEVVRLANEKAYRIRIGASVLNYSLNPRKDYWYYRVMQTQRSRLIWRDYYSKFEIEI